MSANNIAETSTSTGTGNFTLAGAWSQSGTFNTGNLTFNSFYGTNHVFPYMIRDTSGNWESGEGYLSASTTLVRQNVFNNSLGTTAKINFSAGDKLVFVPTDARAFGAKMMNKTAYSSTGQSVGMRGSITLSANTMYVAPHLIIAPCRITTIAFLVRTAAASSTMRVGIYNLVKQSDVGSDYNTIHPLLVDLGTVDVSTTGYKAITTDIKLGQGVYGIAVISNGAPVLMAGTANVNWQGACTNTYENNAISYWQVGNAAYFTALPSSTPDAMTPLPNLGAPQALFKGGIQ
jgi:hypothetical protein